jgi:hypothetical protein
LQHKNICPPGDIVYKEVKEGKHDYADWSRVFPEFMLWAFGKR